MLTGERIHVKEFVENVIIYEIAIVHLSGRLTLFGPVKNYQLIWI